VSSFACERGISIVAYSGDDIICETTDEWTDVFLQYNEATPESRGSWREIAHKFKVHKMILLAPPSTIAEIRRALVDVLHGEATITQAISTMLEVLPLGASKGAGVEILLRELGFEPSQALAIGDAENDIEMLSLVGTSVAMGNAPPNVKEVAAHVTATNSEDGAAQALERFCF